MSLEINLRQSLGIRAARPDFLSPDPDIIEKYFFQFFKSKTLIPDVEDTRKRLQSVGEICGRPSNTVSHKTTLKASFFNWSLWKYIETK